MANPHPELNIPDIYNWTAVYWVCGAGLSNMIQLLSADKRTDCNSNPINFILWKSKVAALNGPAETVPILLELNYIDVNKRWPPYWRAREKFRRNYVIQLGLYHFLRRKK